MLPYLSSLHFHSLLPLCLVVLLFFHLSSLHSRLYFPFLSSILPSLFSFLFEYPIFLPFSSFICFFVPCFPVLIFPHPAFLPFFLTYPFLTLPLLSYLLASILVIYPFFLACVLVFPFLQVLSFLLLEFPFFAPFSPPNLSLHLTTVFSKPNKKPVVRCQDWGDAGTSKKLKYSPDGHKLKWQITIKCLNKK